MPDMKPQHVYVIGAGAFGTALANSIALNGKSVRLICRKQDVCAEINESRTNDRYFTARLSENISASLLSPGAIENRAILFLAIPSGALQEFISTLSSFGHDNLTLVNLAKGLSQHGDILTDILEEGRCGNVATLKGPTFSTELATGQPSGFTLGYKSTADKERITDALRSDRIYLDFSEDIVGIEYMGALKNIYAIAIGAIDAKFNSTNLRFLILTRALKEISVILTLLGGQSETIALYCGVGDLSLTALNDQSRNRTLGLLIGKGFFNESISSNVVLEGLNSIDSVFERTRTHNKNLVILNNLHRLIHGQCGLEEFYQTILTNLNTPAS